MKNKYEDLIESLSFTYAIIKDDDITYEGQLVGEEKAGYGKYTSKDKKSYRLHYSLDLYLEYEIIKYPNGDFYQGYVREGLKHGLGTFTEKGKDEIYGFFIDDELVEEFDDDERDMIDDGEAMDLEFFKKNKK